MNGDAKSWKTAGLYVLPSKELSLPIPLDLAS